MIDFEQSVFSAKALDFLANSTARLNIAHGSVRSSKTVNCSLRWISYCIEGPKGDLLMSGKTVATLQRNVLNDLFDIIGPSNYKWINRQQGEIQILGRRVHLVGANSEEAESKIRGATLAGAYCDEVSLYPQSFWDMLMTRLSVKGALCFCNCNPGDPDHWFYKDVIINPEITNKRVWHFTLDDNPNLDPEYRESLEQMFTGVFYDRMILGLWVVAEGIIYRRFAEHVDDYVITSDPKDLLFSVIAIDFGGNGSGHAFNCTGITRGYKKVVTLADFWSNEEYDAEQLSNVFCDFVEDQVKLNRRVKEIRVDSEATVLIRTIKNKLRARGIGIEVKNAVKGIIWNRIQFYMLLFGKGAYAVRQECKHTIDSFKKARWHPKKKDERLDDQTTNIDNIDAQEYTTESFQKVITDVLLLRRAV